MYIFLKVSLHAPVLTDSVTASATFLAKNAMPVHLSTFGTHLVKAVFSVIVMFEGRLEPTVICQDSVSASLTLEG